MGLIVDELRDAHGRWTAGGADVELSPSGQGHFGGVSTVRVNGAPAGHVSARGHAIYDAVSAGQRLVSTGHPSKRAAANAVAAHHVKAHGSPVSRGLGPDHQQLKQSTVEGTKADRRARALASAQLNIRAYFKREPDEFSRREYVQNLAKLHGFDPRDLTPS